MDGGTDWLSQVFTIVSPGSILPAGVASRRERISVELLPQRELLAHRVPFLARASELGHLLKKSLVLLHQCLNLVTTRKVRERAIQYCSSRTPSRVMSQT